MDSFTRAHVTLAILKEEKNNMKRLSWFSMHENKFCKKNLLCIICNNLTVSGKLYIFALYDLAYSTVLYCTVLYCTVLYCTVLYCTVLYCTVLYCTVLYCTVLYCTVLYCTVLYCNVELIYALYCSVLQDT